MTTIQAAEINSWKDEYKNLGINSKTLIERFIKTMETISKKIGSSISGASKDRGEAKAIYRLLANDKITEEVVLDSHRKTTIKKIETCEEKVILAIQDTSELNYTSHKKTTGLGEYGTVKGSRGLLVHSTIAVTTEGICLGLLGQKIWARDPQDRGKSKENSKRSIEEKESYKWLEGMDNCNGISKDKDIVNVCDREADVYEFFQKSNEEDKKFLVRVVQNRNTIEECKIFDKVQNQQSAGTVIIEVPRDTRKNIKKRTATLDIKYTKVKICLPQNLQKRYGKNGHLEIYIILAKEINAPDGIEPIEWYLATNIEVTNKSEAMEKVRWYVQRWKIERFHYILKSGCKIEELQERDAEKLKKLILMYSIISAKLLCITYFARLYPEVSCEEIFEENEWKILYCMANRTRNLPQKVPTIKEAILYIARLGGFLGRKGDGEPGVKVIWKGFRELNTVLEYHQYLT
jgi:hypothetical protein